MTIRGYTRITTIAAAGLLVCAWVGAFGVVPPSGRERGGPRGILSEPVRLPAMGLRREPTRAPRRSNYERVERDWDRSDGRIPDDPTWELYRLRTNREGRLLDGPGRPRREAERFDEERDREQRLRRRANARREIQRPGPAPRDAGRDASPKPAPRVRAAFPPLARHLREVERPPADAGPLENARRERDRTLYALHRAEQGELKAAQDELPANPVALAGKRAGIDKKYRQLWREAIDKYEQVRAGVPPRPQPKGDATDAPGQPEGSAGPQATEPRD